MKRRGITLLQGDLLTIGSLVLGGAFGVLVAFIHLAWIGGGQ